MPTLFSQPVAVSQIPVANKPADATDTLFRGWFGVTQFTLLIPDETVAHMVFEKDTNGNLFSRVIAQTASDPVVTRSFGPDGKLQTRVDLGHVAAIPLYKGLDGKWHRPKA